MTSPEFRTAAPPTVLGVDAGNTKTIALVAATDGSILGAARAGCGDIYAAGVDAALAEIDAAVTDALAAAGLRPADLAAGAFSLAGADWPEDFDLLRSALASRGYGREPVVVNDALGALRAGTADARDGIGVVVACGTGVATGARGPGGASWHASFWQEPNGALELARRTLAAVYRAELGLAPPTTLTGRVLAHTGLPTIEAVLHAHTRRGGGLVTAEVSAFARAVLDEAAVADRTASAIARDLGESLGDYALVAARRVGLGASSFPLVLAGGVFRHPGAALIEALITRVRAALPDVRPVHSRFEPAVGALLLALDAAGTAVDPPLLARVTATLPPTAVFAT